MQAFWPNKVKLQHSVAPPKNPLNLGDPFDEEHGIIKSNDERDGTIDVEFFKKWNPISKEDNEAQRFPDHHYGRHSWLEQFGPGHFDSSQAFGPG